MPLILHKDIENGEIGLWEISEELEELEHLAGLSRDDSITYSGISALHRKKEWLATRAILNELTRETTEIKYYTDGRPYLESCKYNISISHTDGFVAIMLHEISFPGIDIEQSSRQISKVASRFLSPDEADACRVTTEFSNHKLLLHWCAKEAIFKMVPFSDVEFSTDIHIKLSDPIQDSGSLQGLFFGKSGQISIALEYLEIKGVIMVWGKSAHEYSQIAQLPQRLKNTKDH